VTEPSPLGAAFDRVATEYDAALAEGLSATGEDKDYYARGRAAWLARRLRERGIRPRRVLDFGCGTGSSIPHLNSELRPTLTYGIDVSTASIREARRSHGGREDVAFGTVEELPAGDRFDLAFCNGVFHHIAPADRASALAFVRRHLAPGGVFAFWENNPWNPGTRYVMARIPFDVGAETLSPPAARRLLVGAGFRVLTTDFLFYFPRVLEALRPIEPLLARIPLGGQYLVLCRASAA
jgi:SAM-dependent methyltransferase